MDEKGKYTYVFGRGICMEQADELQQILTPVFEKASLRTFVCDLENVQVCDSSGIRLLLLLRRKAKAAGVRFILYRPRQLFRELLATTNLAHVFDVRDSLDEK